MQLESEFSGLGICTSSRAGILRNCLEPSLVGSPRGVKGSIGEFAPKAMSTHPPDVINSLAPKLIDFPNSRNKPHRNLQNMTDLPGRCVGFKFSALNYFL